mmetsp:Transcript_26566/g.61847  ORF Transcript_26566/g.61847 Transcript_26566/m.61847 type:complete len:200 (+) Transcript_26566:3051-3650(+)
MSARSASQRSFVLAAIANRSSKSTQNSLRSSCSKSGAAVLWSTRIRSFLRKLSISCAISLRFAADSSDSSTSSSSPIAASAPAAGGIHTGKAFTSVSSNSSAKSPGEASPNASSSSAFKCVSSGAIAMPEPGSLHTMMPSVPPVLIVTVPSRLQAAWAVPPLYGLCMVLQSSSPPSGRPSLSTVPSIDPTVKIVALKLR